MTTPFWCLLVVVVMPYVLAGTGGYLRTKQLGSLDNAHPRVQALELRGIAARAYAAQENAWEAFAVFTAAVVVNHLAGADSDTSATVSVIFVIARISHAVMYIQNIALGRSLSFLVGLVCCLTLFGLAVRA